MRLFAIVALLLIATPVIASESVLPGLERAIKRGNELSQNQRDQTCRLLDRAETRRNNRAIENILEDSNSIQRRNRIVLEDSDESLYESSSRRDRRR